MLSEILGERGRNTYMVEKPFFLYYAPGACHAPHHVPREWIERYKGRFDMGYEALREQTLARQKELGLVPADTEPPPLNPIGTTETRTGPDGKQFPMLDVTRPWERSARRRSGPSPESSRSAARASASAARAARE
jgi:arylsulfatase A-like enzyme